MNSEAIGDGTAIDHSGEGDLCRESIVVDGGGDFRSYS